MDRLKKLAEGLGEKDVLISPVMTEADKLTKRWEELERQARYRIKSLEECIMEAQEWECKILCVQDWLQDKDMLLTSHLEHELTVDDLPDETQVSPVTFFSIRASTGQCWDVFTLHLYVCFIWKHVKTESLLIGIGY